MIEVNRNIFLIENRNRNFPLYLITDKLKLCLKPFFRSNGVSFLSKLTNELYYIIYLNPTL